MLSARLHNAKINAVKAIYKSLPLGYFISLPMAVLAKYGTEIYCEDLFARELSVKNGCDYIDYKPSCSDPVYGDVIEKNIIDDAKAHAHQISTYATIGTASTVFCGIIFASVLGGAIYGFIKTPAANLPARVATPSELEEGQALPIREIEERDDEQYAKPSQLGLFATQQKTTIDERTPLLSTSPQRP